MKVCVVVAEYFFLSRGLVGRKAAVVATLFVAIPSASFLFWTYQSNGYPLTVLFCATTLLFADRLARKEGSWLVAAAFGLSAGLGWWNSIQTAAALAPAALVHLAALAWVAALAGRCAWRRLRSRAAPSPWMVLSRFAGEVDIRVSRTGDKGEIRDLGNGNWVFLPTPTPPKDETPAEAARRFQSAIWPARPVERQTP